MKKFVLLFSLVLPQLVFAAEASHECTITEMKNYMTLNRVVARKRIEYPRGSSVSVMGYMDHANKVYVNCSYDNRGPALELVCTVTAMGVTKSVMRMDARSSGVTMFAEVSASRGFEISCKE